MSSLNKMSYENTLSSLYENPSFLNPVWRVIYQEAVRGNHLLFQDLPGFSRMQSLTLGRLQIKDISSNAIEICFSNMLMGTSYQEIIAVIRDCTPQQQLLLFSLYQRVIKRWTHQLKNSLN